MVIDGGYNFSENAEANDENLLVIESTAIARAYDSYFTALFAEYQKNGANCRRYNLRKGFNDVRATLQPVNPRVTGYALRRGTKR